MASIQNEIYPIAGAIAILAFLVWLMYRQATTAEWSKISNDERKARKGRS